MSEKNRYFCNVSQQVLSEVVVLRGIYTSHRGVNDIDAHTFGCGKGATPYDGLYRKAPPERGIFLRLQVFERVGVSVVEV